MGRLKAGAFALAALLLVSITIQPAQAQGPTAPSADPASATGDGQVVISELQSSNKNTLRDEDGASSDWIELANLGTTPVNLAGYQLTDQQGGPAWTFPPGVTLVPGQYLVVFASGKDRRNPAAPLHTDFKLSSDDGYLALLTPEGTAASAVLFPDLPTDVSFGLVGGAVSAAAEPRRQYALLASPTPNAPNSGPRPGGPLVVGTTRTIDPRPTGGADLPITAIVTSQQLPLSSVQLVYMTGYGPEVTLPMAASGDNYSATIPASAAPVGALVRWYVQASDSQGSVTRDPPFLSPDSRQYWGVIVADPSDTAQLPVLEMYCQDDKAPFSQTPVGGCSLWFNGSFYDNLSMNRRGVTSLNWPKPKIKIDSKQGSIFRIMPGMKVGEWNLNSEWAEAGENTFMREPLTWEVFNQMGVTSLISFHMHTRFNGAYYGKFAFVEQLDEDTLKRWGYSLEPQVGPLWKSTSGEFSNLRWDIQPNQVPFYWQQYTLKKDNATQAQALVDFARGLAGGAPVPRSRYVFDTVNLPQVINHMAAQTLLLNQDRCTKNFFIYQDPASGQWSMFPWDVESAFGIDRGLGGKPAPDYCILACEQWNSPLYCDANHPQDLTVKTPWGLISAQYDLYSTGRKLLAPGTSCGGGSSDSLAHAARKLLQGQAAAPASDPAAAGPVLPATSALPANVDVDLTKTPTKRGAPGTYNYLIDTLLAVPRTRQMYMRRLRTLMDSFIATGRLESMVTAMYNQIRDEAKRDVAQWGNPGDPDRGYQQLMTEQMPIRRDQLFNQYGPNGPVPLIPGPEPAALPLSLGQLAAGPDGSVEVVNPNAIAMDLSGYQLRGAVQFTFAPGTVIPAQDSVYAAFNLAAFKQQRGGQGLFVVGPVSGQPLGAAASVQLLDAGGASVAST